MVPALELLPDGLGLQSEHCANSHEGERPASLLTQKPCLGFLRLSLDAASLSRKLFLKTGEGVFEHGSHQRRDWTIGEEAGLGVEKLLREHAGVGQLFLPRVPVG